MLSENPHPASRPVRARHMRLHRISLPVALGLLLVGAGCSDDDGGDGGEEEAGSFCVEAQEAMAEVGDELDLEALGEAWRDLDAEVPESIAEDWDLVLERWDELAEAPADDGLDTSAQDDPADVAEADDSEASDDAEDPGDSGDAGDGNGDLDPEAAEAEADRGLELQLAWRSVRSYFRDLCDMDLP